MDKVDLGHAAVAILVLALVLCLFTGPLMLAVAAAWYGNIAGAVVLVAIQVLLWRLVGYPAVST